MGRVAMAILNVVIAAAAPKPALARRLPLAMHWVESVRVLSSEDRSQFYLVRLNHPSSGVIR